MPKYGMPQRGIPYFLCSSDENRRFDRWHPKSRRQRRQAIGWWNLCKRAQRVAVRSAAPRSHPDFDRVGGDFSFLYFIKYPLFRCFENKSRCFAFCTIRLSMALTIRWTLAFKCVYLIGGKRSANTILRSAINKSTIIRQIDTCVYGVFII